MKARPRGVENRVAEELNKVLSDTGWDPIERIPVLGRTGPDLTINQSALAIDVKSRKSVPKMVIGGPKIFDDFIAIPVKDILKPAEPEAAKTSELVLKWYLHMKDWVDKQEGDYLTAVVLHKSYQQMPIGNSAFVMRIPEYHTLLERVENAKGRKAMDGNGGSGHQKEYRRSLRAL